MDRPDSEDRASGILLLIAAAAALVWANSRGADTYESLWRPLRVWINDEDPGLARTMAALDRELGRGQRWSGFLDQACRIPERLCQSRDRWRSRMRRDEPGPDDEPIAA